MSHCHCNGIATTFLILPARGLMVMALTKWTLTRKPKKLSTFSVSLTVTMHTLLHHYCKTQFFKSSWESLSMFLALYMLSMQEIWSVIKMVKQQCFTGMGIEQQEVTIEPLQRHCTWSMMGMWLNSLVCCPNLQIQKGLCWELTPECKMTRSS